LNRLWDLIKVFVDDKPEKGGVPRTQDGTGSKNWGSYGCLTPVR
jgi:hypothetical protein